MAKIGISGCLGCFFCRYDGKGFNDFDLDKAAEYLKRELNLDEIVFIPLCPEQLGGLPTPRVPAEIISGEGQDVLNKKAKVINKEGIDVTKNFVAGAEQVLDYAKKFEITAFLLKEGSPSCGVNEIYSGKFDGTKISGRGVTSALLETNGIKVFSDKIIRNMM